MNEQFRFESAFPHLELRRAEPRGPRWKPTPPGRKPPEDRRQFGLQLQAAVGQSAERARGQPRPAGIDPALVLRVPLLSQVDEARWRQAGFTVVAYEEDKVLILFSSDIEMTAFRTQVEAYVAGRLSRPGQKNPDYSSFLEAIDVARMGPLVPEDRQGRLLREVLSSGGLDPAVVYSLDVELWYLGNRERTDPKVRELRRFVEDRDGAVTDSYLREELCMVRVRLAGANVGELLTIPSIATVDLPPTAGYTVAEIRDSGLDEVRILAPPHADAPHICVIDSGIARGHPLLGDAVGETIAVPPSLGDGLDVHGHGSMVAGLALYGDVEQCRQIGEFRQWFWIDAARVTDANNQLSDERLVPSQMRDAITYFAGQGCRIFNISLGDPRLPYEDGQPSAWASTLDNLAHELDILIVVSAGNYEPPTQPFHLNAARNHYPAYLLEPDARIIEPATAANALTVGAVAMEGQPYANQQPPFLAVTQPQLAGEREPAPFTRTGFGVRGAIKPDLVEYGGNYAYDGQMNRIPMKDPGLSIVSLNHRWGTTGQLFTFDRGTSMAAPRVAHAAGQLLDALPAASANLIRALLVHGAERPSTADRLALPHPEDVLRLYGFGLPNLKRSLNSSESRVVLYAEDQIPLDWFHIYEIPIPDMFKESEFRKYEF